MIAQSPSVKSYIIGFTSQSLRDRFRPYQSNGYEYAVLLCDRLTRSEALQLEEHIFREMKTMKGAANGKQLYDKYEKSRRDGPYSPSYGGKGEANARQHGVYMVWWA